MAQKFPPLNALRAFDVASRTGSFTLAARELSVSQGAVSRHIAHLEDFLGVQLFERGPREVKLTADGEAYATEIQGAFERIVRSTHSISRRRPSTLLRVSVFPSIAAHWLMPRLTRFRKAHPEIDLYITATSRPDLRSDNADIANFRGVPDTAAFEYLPLFDVILQPVCSPTLLAGLSRPYDVAILKKMTILCSQHRIADWQLWLHAAGITGIEPSQGLRFENSAMAYQAAIDGLGVTIAQTEVLQDEIASGRLTAPFDITVKSGESYGLVWPRSKAQQPAVKAFRDWFVGETSGSPHRAGGR